MSGSMAADAGRPNSRPIRSVGVVGAGVMGAGLTHWIAARGFPVAWRDLRPECLQRGLGVVHGLFEESVRRGKLSAADAAEARARIAPTPGWEGFAGCDLVVEAIVEDAAAKRRLFAELAARVRPDALLASNTSALPIEEIAGEVVHPERTLGIHFFNPVSRMTLVELVVGRATAESTVNQALAWVQALGKWPLVCRSSPGFVVTRVLFFYLNEAVRLWEAGRGVTEIDDALRAFGWPMGPLRLIDEVGLDVTDFIFGEMAHYFPGRFARTHACGRLLALGLKGRKDGASRGFHRYDGAEPTANEAEIASAREGREPARVGWADVDLVAHLMRVMIAEARRCLDEGVVASADDIDLAMARGAGFPADKGGLLHWARTAGLR